MNLDKKIGYLARERQKACLDERKKADLKTVGVCGLNFEIHQGVYQTAKDTELMADVVQINASETFLELGCGCGAISIILSKKARECIGIDINPLAVNNSKSNATLHKVNNVSFVLGDLFEGITAKYNVILFNPPYAAFESKDEIDKMFWDTNNSSKIAFFEQVGKYLKSNGRIYFGWADFDDIDKNLPLQLAKENGLLLKETYTKKVENKPYTYIVFEFVKDTKKD